MANLLYFIPFVNVWWFCHWKNPYDYFEQNVDLGLFGCLFITPAAGAGLVVLFVL